RDIINDPPISLPDVGEGESVLVEFVSANPTGPLHVGHGRGAVYGDVLCRLFNVLGYEVTREYYVNDAGTQMEKLGESLQLRSRERDGESVELEEDHYKGDYIREIVDQHDLGPDDSPKEWAEVGKRVILDKIFEVLDRCDIEFDSVQSEREIAPREQVDRLIDSLQKEQLIKEEEGAVFLKTTKYGDDKDRVLIRDNGEPTYFANDMAYHHDKFERNFDRYIDIWGHDHHGYQKRLESAMYFLGHDTEKFEIELYQLVNLFRGDQPVSMSTREGEFESLEDLVQEVGVDPVRFNFLTTRHSSPLDFDIELAVSESEENPVYYVQYAHTRMASILDNVPEEFDLTGDTRQKLTDKGHRLLIKTLNFPHVLTNALQSREPHRLTFWLREISNDFHSYYGEHQILDTSAPAKTRLRLSVIRLVKLSIKQGLDLLGVHAPVSM
ncbi:MAG: arginine--tRNA ligase, partial [bacterium]